MKRPILTPIKANPSGVVILCPYCDKKHTHGYANGMYEGYRVPHCHDIRGKPDYYIAKMKEEGDCHA